MKKISLLAFTIFSLNSFSQDQVVATVNGKNILKKDFDVYYKQALLYPSTRTITAKVALSDMINKILGVEKAEQNNLRNDAQVKERIEDILYHAQISKDLEGKLLKIPEPTDSELKNYYSNNKEYRTAHILLRLRVIPTENEVQETYKKALDIHAAALKNPDKFIELAAQFSQTTNAPIGGDLGFQPAVKLDPKYYEAIKGKAKDTILKPVRTQYGFHIIKVLGVKTYEQVDKNMYKKIIYDQKRDKILADYFAGLQSKAKIKINESLLQ
jgi:peptidyl-prolyl cis-trans isomerase C